MEILAVAVDTAEDSTALSEKLPGITFANDRSSRVVTGYGRAAGENVLPATFVIDAAGVVRFAHRASKAEEWPSVAAVRAAIAALPAR